MGTIKSNFYYNDPAIAQIAANLSSIFAPPDGADAAGWAKARSLNDQNSRLKTLFDYTQNPNFNQSTFDRMGIAAGNYAPNQSYYFVDQNNATLRANNAADNARILQTNAADNAQRDRHDTLDARTDIVKNQYGALNEGQTRPGMPDSVAEGYGLPATTPQTGIVKVNEGQTATLPSGQVIAGTPKPLTMDQWQAQQALRLQQSGQINDTALQDIIMGKEKPVRAIGPDGKTPVYMSPGAAIRTNAPAYDRPAGKPEVLNYSTPGGRAGTAALGPDGALYDTQTGEKLAPGTMSYKGQAQGTPDQFSGKPTEASDKAASFSVRGAAANDTLNGMLDAGYVPNARDYESGFGAIGNSLPLSLSNSLISADGQKFNAATSDFLNAVLRPDTGAAFSNAELQNYARTFIPLPGDAPETLAAKRQARAMAIAVTSGNSRGGADRLAEGLQQLNLPVPSGLVRHLIVPPAGGAPAPVPAPGTGTGQHTAPPVGAIEMLRKNPNLATHFDEKYGQGAAAAVLGGH